MRRSESESTLKPQALRPSSCVGRRFGSDRRLHTETSLIDLIPIGEYSVNREVDTAGAEGVGKDLAEECAVALPTSAASAATTAPAVRLARMDGARPHNLYRTTRSGYRAQCL